MLLGIVCFLLTQRRVTILVCLPKLSETFGDFAHSALALSAHAHEFEFEFEVGS